MARKTVMTTLIVMTAGLLLLNGNPVDPIHVNSARVEQASGRHRSQRIRIGHTIYTIKNVEPTDEKLSHAQIRTDLRQLKTQTLHDVKMERADNLSTSIAPNRKLNRLATIRARQVAKRFSHYSRNHRPMTTVDAKRAKLPHGFQASENIASAGLGNCTVVGDPKIYHNHNGRDMANMSNDGMMNYDIMENNGHRKNILSNDTTLIGIGAAYSQRKHKFYLAEDFGNRDPRSSADVSRKHLGIHLKPRQVTTLQRVWHGIKVWTGRTYRGVVNWIRDRI